MMLLPAPERWVYGHPVEDGRIFGLCRGKKSLGLKIAAETEKRRVNLTEKATRGLKTDYNHEAFSSSAETISCHYITYSFHWKI